MSVAASAIKSGRSSASVSPIVVAKNSKATTNYSNIDLRNMINIGRDARIVIISRKKEREEFEAYGPSSNYRIPENCPGSSEKRKHVNADF